MKKILLAGAIAVSAVALASTTSVQRVTVLNTRIYHDTVPGKRDTSVLPKPDTTVPPPMMFGS